MHGTTMIFLALMPMTVAFFNYIVPLQIGARDVAFPRLNAFSYWTFLFGAILHQHQLAVARGAGRRLVRLCAADIQGRTRPSRNIDFWIARVCRCSAWRPSAGALNFFVTIINMRAPGMSLMRMPIFCWTTLITSVLMVLAFPAITDRADRC